MTEAGGDSATRAKPLGKRKWDRLSEREVEFQFSIAESVLKELVLSHDPSDVLRELVQNEYDAQGTRIEVHFAGEAVAVTGNGRPIDAAGWKRLGVMLGTGRVTGSSPRGVGQDERHWIEKLRASCVIPLRRPDLHQIRRSPDCPRPPKRGAATATERKTLVRVPRRPHRSALPTCPEGRPRTIRSS